jgi:hypothetical protein
MAPVEVRYCACGATRAVPASLRIVGCVRCGRALMLAPQMPAAAPSTPLAAVAALASQLLGAAMFCVVLAWAWSTHPGDRAFVGALLALGASWVLVAGSALRGSLVALGYCLVLDLALAVLVAADHARVGGFVQSATTKLVPAVATHVGLVCAIAGGLAAFAAVTWLVAIPHVRRTAAWHDAQAARLA